MELTDIQAIDKWIDFENDIRQRSGLMASVYNIKGIRITGRRHWPNRLCPAIKATDRGQAFICAVAHMNLAIIAEKTRAPVIEECDAGLIKVVVPIFAGEEFLGAFGGCGLLFEDGEVDSFMINKTTDIPEEEIEALSAEIPTIDREQAQGLATYVQERLAAITADFDHRPTG
jgi:ligand-binding sensor protein